MAIVASATPLWAGAGRTGSAQLRLLTSPRASAMGESSTGLADSFLDALALNPAGLAQLAYREAAFGYIRWLEGIHQEDLAYAHPTRKGTLALSSSLFRVGDFPAYDASGGRVGSVGAQSLSGRLAWAQRLRGPREDARWGLFAGASLRWLREELATVRATGNLFDAGLLYRWRPPGRPGSWGLGASAQSVGGGLTFDSEDSPAPRTFRLGLSHVLPVFGDPLSLVLDARLPRDSKNTWGLGAEYLLKGILAWRLGYTSGQDLGSGFRMGLGIHLKVVRLDYSMASYSGFGLAHRIGLSARFGEPIEKSRFVTPAEERAEWHYQRARRMFDTGRYYEAVLDLDKALQSDPHHNKALELMKWSRQRLEELK